VKFARNLLVASTLLILLAGCFSPAPVNPGGAGTNAPAAPSEPATVESLAFNASGLLGGTAAPSFGDGDPGEVSVVSIGALVKPGYGSATLLFAFRNNTPAAIAHVDWIGTARADGAMVATGSSQGTIPAQVAPGEVGLAYIYFENGDSIPEGAEYEFEVETSPADMSFYNSAPLRVTEANVVGDSIVGAATNDTGAEVTGPYSVQIFCFDGDALIGHSLSFAEQDGDLEPDHTATFSVSLYDDPCPTFAVGVDGYFS